MDISYARLMKVVRGYVHEVHIKAYFKEYPEGLKVVFHQGGEVYESRQFYEKTADGIGHSLNAMFDELKAMHEKALKGIEAARIG